MPTHVLITGVTGPVGSFLADYLLTLPDVELHAFKRWRSDPRPIQQLLGRVTFHEGDIEDPFAVAAAVRDAAPDRVYHLAAQPSASIAGPPIGNWLYTRPRRARYGRPHRMASARSHRSCLGCSTTIATACMCWSHARSIM